MLSSMAMNFEELDGPTRGWMLTRFEAEEASGNAYRSKPLSLAGLAGFPDLMRDNIGDPDGNEVTLELALNRPEFWNPTELYVRKGVERERNVNSGQASERLALTEFNTWYVCGAGASACL